MKKKISIRYISSILLCTVLLMTAFTQYACAFTKIETNRRDAAIMIEETYAVKDKTIPLPEIEIRLWKVASVTEGARFVLLKDWKDSQIPVNGLTAEEWKNSAEALLAYANINGQEKQPDFTGKTDNNGKVTLTDLETGLYLASPAKTTVRVAGYVVNLEPAFLISVPYQASSDRDSECFYTVPVVPKNEAKPYSPPEKEITYTVRKIWQDDGYTQKRPAQIFVRLLQDGKPYTGADGVVALQGESWSYTWHNLSDSFEYSVEEIYVPAGYESSTNGNVITNTLKKTEEEPPEKPDEPNKPRKDNDGKSPQHPEDGDGNGGKPSMHNPKTGDSLMLGLWTILAGGAAGGLVWFLKKKK